MSVSPRRPRRVVITGLGVASPIGCDLAKFWDLLIRGQSGVAPLDNTVPNAYPVPFAGAVRDFAGSVEDFGELDDKLKKNVKKGLKLMCRETQMGVAVAQKALADAAVQGRVEPERIGVSFGTGYMLTQPEDMSAAMRACADEQGDFQFAGWGTAGIKSIQPLWLLKYLPNMPACHIAIYNDFRGPNNSITHGEAAANLALGEAARVIARGSADVMVAGATGTRLHPLRSIQAAIQEEIALADPNVDPASISRPFDRARQGMVMGEGAAAVVLEELECALKRGAHIYGELIGAGSSCVVGRDHVARRETASANAMRAAMRSAGVSPDDVGHLHAHGLSTHSSDVAESLAVHKVFDGAAKKLPVVAAKSHFGNLGAGSGAVEIVGSLLALNHGPLFPVLNYETPDPECGVAAVHSNDRPAGEMFVNVNCNNNGQASAVVIRKFAA